tara:strand:- start:3127 stop:3339 length:213 start_codon:yes stop_codon:yes gene_type:complete
LPTSADGRYAQVLLTGPYSGIHTAYEYIAVDWLEHSGEDVGGESCMEIYLNDPTNTAPDAVQALVSVPRE